MVWRSNTSRRMKVIEDGRFRIIEGLGSLKDEDGRSVKPVQDVEDRRRKTSSFDRRKCDVNG